MVYWWGGQGVVVMSGVTEGVLDALRCPQLPSERGGAAARFGAVGGVTRLTADGELSGGWRSLCVCWPGVGVTVPMYWATG